MSNVLTRPALPTTRSFLSGHSVELPPARDPRHQPLAYQYSVPWDGSFAAPQGGSFDEESQTWVFPADVPQAGVNTNTRTTCYGGSDTCRDDFCA
jgi:hypothetical protein